MSSFLKVFYLIIETVIPKKRSSKEQYLLLQQEAQTKMKMMYGMYSCLFQIPSLFAQGHRYNYVSEFLFRS